MDECVSISMSIKELLMTNFKRSYDGNRAPVQVHLQARSLQNKLLLREVEQFLQDIMFDDVWIVTYQVGEGGESVCL